MKRILSYPLRLIDSALDRICGILGALLLSQIPGFISHYVQRLGGHLAEAQRNADSWQTIADKTTGGSLSLLTREYLSSDIRTTVEAGNKCLADIGRLNKLQEALEAINEASPWSRAIVFLRHMDADIARSTLESYVPNLPIDFESLMYAAAGLALAVLLYHIIKWIFKLIGVKILKRIKRRKEATEQPPGQAPDQENHE